MTIELPRCPVCGAEDRDSCALAVHLMQKHSWEAQEAQDWLRKYEEGKENQYA